MHAGVSSQVSSLGAVRGELYVYSFAMAYCFIQSINFVFVITYVIHGRSLFAIPSGF